MIVVYRGTVLNETYIDTLIHAFWDCSKSNKVWFDMEYWLSEVLGVNFNFNPSACIF